MNMEIGDAVISIDPPQAQFVLQPSVSRGTPFAVAFEPGDQGAVGIGIPVSYTHLTLPTILLV